MIGDDTSSACGFGLGANLVHGRIHMLSPWHLVDYWSWTREPSLRDFEFS